MLPLALPALVQAQFNFTIIADAITITGYTGPGGPVVIPGTYAGLPVTGIGDYAFIYCNSLTSVTIPSSVTTIGDGPFSCCARLGAITVDAPNPAYSSLGGVLFDKSQTRLIQYPGGEAGSYIIPSGVTNIGDGAFSCCTNLATVTIPSSVLSIGDNAFGYCTSLASVYFQGNAAVYGYIFDGDINVTVHYLPETSSATFAGFGVQTNGFGFTITGPSGLAIVVEACTNLAKPIWSPLVTNTLAGGSFYFSDPQWTKHPCRFYRIRSP